MIHALLLRWYRCHGRHALPWRIRRDPYRILVSEIMLQQTQVDRVLTKYNTFLKQFPTLHSLSHSPVSRVLRAWQGMGYNRRALNLQRAARCIVHEHRSVIPSSIAALKQLPGIGEYTARALAVFAFGAPVVAMDVNIERVLDRFFFGGETRREKRPGLRRLLAIGDALVEESASAYGMNQALMDLGALVCTAKKPRCSICPLRSPCRAYPDILSLSLSPISLSRLSRLRPEPSFAGVPRRLWRGKIVELLRSRAAPIGVERLLAALGVGSDGKARAWFKQVLEQLTVEGMVQERKRKGQNVYLL